MRACVVGRKEDAMPIDTNDPTAALSQLTTGIADIIKDMK